MKAMAQAVVNLFLFYFIIIIIIFNGGCGQLLQTYKTLESIKDSRIL